MGSADTFEVVRDRTDTSVKIQRSEFIGIAFPAATAPAFDDALSAIQKQYFDATHHCWAYRLFADGKIAERSSDAGEPSGTAGRPIANAIVSANLHDTAVVVVRYYGGVKLGTGGLARAYRDAAANVLSTAPRTTRYLLTRVAVTVPFEKMNAAYRLVSPPDVRLEREDFGETNIFHYLVRNGRVETFTKTLVESRFDHSTGDTIIL